MTDRLVDTGPAAAGDGTDLGASSPVGGRAARSVTSGFAGSPFTFAAARAAAATSANTTSSTVMAMVAQTNPPSPNSDMATLVASADPNTLTALLPISIDPIRPSRSARSSSTMAARPLPLVASWRIRASDAAVKAVSALEKNADAKIKNKMIRAKTHRLASIGTSF